MRRGRHRMRNGTLLSPQLIFCCYLFPSLTPYPVLASHPRTLSSGGGGSDVSSSGGNRSGNFSLNHPAAASASALDNASAVGEGSIGFSHSSIGPGRSGGYEGRPSIDGRMAANAVGGYEARPSIDGRLTRVLTMSGGGGGPSGEAGRKIATDAQVCLIVVRKSLFSVPSRDPGF